MSVDIRANVGQIIIGTKTFAYCTGIEVNSDDNPIKVFAGDRKYPVYVGAGNSEMTITVDAAEYKADDTYILETVKQNQEAVTVQLETGERGGGIAATSYDNCVVTNYTVTSASGSEVKARIILSRQAAS